MKAHLAKFLVVCVMTAASAISCEKTNTAPVADFSFSPGSGAMDTLFTFDASPSSDREDKAGELEFRWDWEADGIWDTEFSTERIATHRFTQFTDNRVELQIRDTRGLTASVRKEISIADAGIITGFDPRMCVCCGGWFIRIRDLTVRFDQVPEESRNLVEGVEFPINVTVKWSKRNPRCLGDEIILHSLSGR